MTPPSKGRPRPRPRPPPAGPAGPPEPFGRAAETLAPFLAQLPHNNAYIAHVDEKPRAFKQQVFLAPVVLNVAVVLLLALRARFALPFYLGLAGPLLGLSFPLPLADGAGRFDADRAGWPALLGEIARRLAVLLFDFALFAVLAPWPLDFVAGLGGGRAGCGGPVRWRWRVGFRDREIYVRRSRRWWAGGARGDDGAISTRSSVCEALLTAARRATRPQLLDGKTGYLTLDSHWDLDWDAMVTATALSDHLGTAGLDVFRTVLLVHDSAHGWLSVDLRAPDDRQVGVVGSAVGLVEEGEDERRRRHVRAFQDALAKIGKEDLFFRWVELVQFEIDDPAGFGPVQQAKAAVRVRDMFSAEGVEFDRLWSETVGNSDAKSGP